MKHPLLTLQQAQTMREGVSARREFTLSHFFLLLLLFTVAVPRHFDLAQSFGSAQHAGIMNLFSSCTTAAAAALTSCICSSVSQSSTTARALKYSPTPPTRKCHNRSYSSINLDSRLKLKETVTKMG